MASSLSHFRVAIAKLRPDLDSLDTSSVHGIVTLVWPYASSTQSLCFLLVEPDFRLRRQQGQVRIHFQGPSARVVAEAGLSSGDELELNLLGASWEKDATKTETPGKGIEWQLRFGDYAVLEVGKPLYRANINLIRLLDTTAWASSNPARNQSHSAVTGASETNFVTHKPYFIQ